MALYMNPPKISLSADHIRILSLLVDGKTQDQIALEIDRSRETVKRRCKQIRKELRVESLYQAVAIAISKGWVEAPRAGKQ